MEVQKAKPYIQKDPLEDEKALSQKSSINYHEKTKDTLQILADSISKELENCAINLRRKTKSCHVGNNNENLANNEKK